MGHQFQHLLLGPQDYPLENGLNGSSSIQSSALLSALGIDVCSAFSASIAVAPIVTLVDIAVTQAAFKLKTVSSSIHDSMRKLLLRPHQFFVSRPFAVIFLLYFSTFTTANSVDTLSKTCGLPPGSKLIAATAVNGALSLYKDSQFAQVFVAPASSILMRRTPLKLNVLGPWILRDFGTLAATFSLPPILTSGTGIPISIAQLITPVLSQPFVAPLHLIGMDAYNKPEKTISWNRWRRVRSVWGSVSLAKMGRVLPGLGVGNVLNASVRARLLVQSAGSI